MATNRGAFLSDNIKARATLFEKEKNDFERQREIMDHLDIFWGDYRDYKKIENIKINFDLLNGRLDVDLYEDPLCFSVGKEQVSFDFQNISHTPLIAQYANAIIGEELNKPFIPMIKDHTPNRLNTLQKKANKVVEKYLVENVVNELRTQIMNRMLKDSGATDIFQLASNPEAQMQLEQEINFELSNELPRDVIEFINGDVQSPTARQAQKMLDFLKDKFNIAFEQVKGFKNAVATGEEYYFSGEYNGDLIYQTVNPAYFSWGGGDRENEWCQHGDWAKRERWLSYQQLISRHSEMLDEKDIDLIEVDVEPVGGYYKGTDFWDREKDHTKKLMYTYSVEDGFRNMFSDVNIKTTEGRRKLFQAYDHAFSRYGDIYGTNYSDYGIREAHFQWRDLRPMWVVKRKQKDGSFRQFWLPEHYEPTHLDYDIKRVWKNQVWQGYKLGTFDCVYSGIEAAPYQYKAMFNPHDVDLSYYGKKYNTHDNLTKNVCLVDLGKSAQKNFDMVLASVRHDLSTNIGSAFTLFMNMRPEGWSYQEWLDLLRNANILMMDSKSSMGGVEPQFLKQINLSKMSDIAEKINLLEFYRGQVALSMYFNDVREGAISQYANSTNVEQNSIAVHNKTAFFMEQHRLIVEKSLGGFLNRARHFYKENIEQAAVFLDEVSLAALKASPPSYYEWLGVSLENSPAELQKLNLLKARMLEFIQNGATPEAVMDIIFSDTRTEVKDVIRRETNKMEEKRQQDFEQAQTLQQQQIQANAAEKAAEREFELEKHMSTLQSQEKRTLWDREKFAMQNDIDNNQVNDLLQKTLMEISAKLEMHDDEMDIEREKLKLKKDIETQRARFQKNQKTPTRL